jgi:tetratricopeptide (TPR) repeat protein
MLVKKSKRITKLLAVFFLAIIFLAACATGATDTAEKIELGQKYLTELNYTEAVAAFTEVIKMDPSNIEAYMGRAEAYKCLEQYDDAKADYTTAIEKTDEMPYTQAQAYAGRAEVYDLTDETEAAESDCSAAIALLDEDGVGEKENIAQALIRELRIRVLQFHAEVCMKLGLYDKAAEDYEKLAELGVNMSEDAAADSSQQEAVSADGAYVWTYTDENGTTTKALLNIRPGSKKLGGVIDYPPDMGSDDVAGIITLTIIQAEYPEVVKAMLDLQEKYNSLASSINGNNITEAQLAQIMALEEQENSYAQYEQIFEAEATKWAGVDWRPQIIESFSLSNPVSRVEKTADTLYVYVPTGTRFVKSEMTFTSYSGQSETIDMTAWMKNNSKTDLSKPVYEWDTSSNATGSFKMVYREDK